MSIFCSVNNEVTTLLDIFKNRVGSDAYISDGRNDVKAKILEIRPSYNVGNDFYVELSVENKYVPKNINNTESVPNWFYQTFTRTDYSTSSTSDRVREDVRVCTDPIRKVIFHDPAVIVFWNDGSKTVVKCGENDVWDPEKGLAMAIAKKFLGNKGNYNNILKKHLPDE